MPKTINLTFALSYLSRGWSVIPVNEQKLPLVAWADFQKRLATPEEVFRWWEQYPQAQIGVITGKISNLTVIDVEKDGDFSLIKQKTRTAKTGGGGRHYYFLFDPDFKTCARLRENLDIRSEGGYVVAPPSKMEKGLYEFLDEHEVVPIGGDLKRLLLGENKGNKDVFGAPFAATHTPRKGPLPFTGAPEGARNESMTRYLGSLLAHYPQEEWDTEVWALFQEANQKNTPPLKERELRTIWNSISAREKKQNPLGRKKFTLATERGIRETVREINENKNISPEKKEVLQKIFSTEENPEEPAEVLHIKDVVERQRQDFSHTFTTGMKIFDDALLGGFSAGEIIVAAGPSGHGKTTLMQDWTTTMVSGNFGNTKPVPSMWFTYEVFVTQLWKKFLSMGVGENAPLYLPSYNESGALQWVVEMIVEGIQKFGVKFVVIDHLGFLTPPKGNYANDSAAVTHTVRFLKRLATETGIIIALPVHIRKLHSPRAAITLDDVKDSSGIVQEADTVFFIQREYDDNTIYTENTRIWLQKNRKTGNTASGFFVFRLGKFHYSESITQQREAISHAEKNVEEAWRNVEKIVEKESAPRKKNDEERSHPPENAEKRGVPKLEEDEKRMYRQIIESNW